MSTPRRLDEARTRYRIGDPNGRFRIFSGEGAALDDARWHGRGQEVIYCSEHYSTAMLEKLVHFNGVPPSQQHFVRVTLPAGLTYEVVTKDSLALWHDSNVSRSFGSVWLTSKRSAV